MTTLCAHDIHLWDGPLHLRPMTEDDWGVLLKWNNDPEVLYYTEGDDITSWSLDDMQALYRDISRQAHVFVSELGGTPIGECWLQKMNLARVVQRYPGLDVRRIDLMIGEKALWGQGWGTRVIRLLTRFAFDACGVDILYQPEVADYNVRSRRAFERNGHLVAQEVPQPAGRKARVGYDLYLTRERYTRLTLGPEG